MSRALVLGGGGPLGVGWEAGFLAGLADAGVVLEDADLVIGTSAGAIVGAQLTSGRPLVDLVASVSEAPPWAADGSGDEPQDLGEMLAARAGGTTVSEADWVAHFDYLGGVDWPESFRCTAFDLEAGQFALWDRASGVELPRGVASSCTVPGLAPPVTIADGHYIDGGARDVLNADLAVGHDVVVVLSCMALEPPDGAVPELLAGLLPAVRQRIDELRTTGSTVEVVEPSEAFLELSGWGRWLMAVSRTADAFAAGLHQGAATASRIQPLWSEGS